MLWDIKNSLKSVRYFHQTGFLGLTWGTCHVGVGLFSSICLVKQFEPLLLVPSVSGFYRQLSSHPLMGFPKKGPDLLQVFYRYGVSWESSLRHLFGLEAMTDFEPLIA